MRAHAYSHMCGCAQCCRVERAAERDAETLATCRAELCASPALLAEVCLDDAQAVRAARHLWHGGDPAAFVAVWREAVEAHVDELIAQRAAERGCPPGEAAAGLCEVYRPALGAAA